MTINTIISSIMTMPPNVLFRYSFFFLLFLSIHLRKIGLHVEILSCYNQS
jgi:hypothetical protein